MQLMARGPSSTRLARVLAVSTSAWHHVLPSARFVSVPYPTALNLIVIVAKPTHSISSLLMYLMVFDSVLHELLVVASLGNAAPSAK
jgi:hypothetical protein